MSRYGLGKLFFDANRDRSFALVKRFQADPEGVLAEYDLTDTERRAVMARDIRTVYEAGVHPLLVRMGGLALLGLRDVNEYKTALEGAVQQDD